VNVWFAVFCVLSALLSLQEAGLGRPASVGAPGLGWPSQSVWMFFVLSTFYLSVAFMGKKAVLRSGLFHLAASGPPVALAVADRVIAPVAHPAKVCPHGFVRAFEFTDTPIGEAASVWNDLIWVVTASIPIYMVLTAKADATKRQSRLVVVAYALVFLLYMAERTHLEFWGAHAGVLIGPVMLLSLLLLAAAIYRYEVIPLTPAIAGEDAIAILSDAVLIVGEDHRIERGNKAAGALIGSSLDDLRGKEISSLFPEGSAIPRWITDPASAAAAGAGMLETEWATRSGERIPVVVRSGPVLDGRGAVTGHIVVARDIADQRRKAAELAEHREYLERMVQNRTKELHGANESLHRSRLILRTLSERLFVAREEESARIARELHDELGQILTGLKIDVTLLGRKVDRPDHRVLIDDITALADTTIKRVQTLTKELRPPMLEKLGMVAAAESLVSEFGRRQGIACHLSHDMETEDLPLAVLTTAYRIMQEALENAAKHSEASTVKIHLAATSEALDIAILDDGVGIAKGRVSAFESLGILGMKERALTFGGRVDISRSKGGGTAVRIHLPAVLE
jgi:PAS domain S-box-containing protein